MAPKAAQKAKKDITAAPTAGKPPPVKPKAAKAPKPPTTTKKTLPNPPRVLQAVPKNENHGPLPIEVTYRGESEQSKLVKGDYAHSLELHSPRSFSLVETVIAPDGKYAGLQIIVLQPSKAFPFLKLPDEARARIYGWYFAPCGVLHGDIVLETKRKDTKDMFAKAYSESSPYRVALLRVNKEVHDGAVQVLYGNTLRLETTTTLLDFLGQIPPTVRPRLSSIAVASYIKTTSRNAMHFLAEAGNVQHLHIDKGVFGECDPDKAAKAFHADAYKFLEAVAATKGSKSAGVDVLTFGKLAFSRKDEQKNVKPWSEEQVAEFKVALKEKMEK